MLRLQHLRYQLKDRTLLHPVDLEAAPGHLWAVVGPNGAGKSVLLQLLAGSWKPTGGEVLWKEKPLSRHDPKQLARERAVLFQHPQMALELTVEEVILMGRYPHFRHQPGPLDFEAVDRALALTQLEHFARRAYHRLSGGEQQRVHVARVLAQLTAPYSADHLGRAQWLLLDEPLNHLDVRYQHLLLDLLGRYARRGHLVWMVLHDLNLAARYADRMLLLQQGHSRAQGPPEAVLQPELLSEVYGLPVEVDTERREARFSLPDTGQSLESNRFQSTPNTCHHV